jgi:Fic family protein
VINEKLKLADEYKIQINLLKLFEGHNLRQLRDYFRIGLTYTSNAIEGNTLTESETKVVLEDGLTIGGKPLRDTLEAVGHARSYDYMLKLRYSGSLTIEDIKEMHRIFYSLIDSEKAGVYRAIPVIITGSIYPTTPPDEIEQKMIELGRWMESENTRMHPIIFAAQLHKRLVFIHPFIDGNGRIARLALNTALIQKQYLPTIISTRLRSEYFALLEKAHVDDKGFVEFIIDRVIDTERDILRLFNYET